MAGSSQRQPWLHGERSGRQHAGALNVAGLLVDRVVRLLVQTSLFCTILAVFDSLEPLISGPIGESLYRCNGAKLCALEQLDMGSYPRAISEKVSYPA